MEILDTGFDMDAYEMKKHMFTVTTMTPKLCDALQVVEAMFEEDRRHWWTSLFGPVARRTPAVEQLGPTRYLLGTLAVEIGVQVNGPGIQRRRHGQHLKSGPRLVAVGENPVAPLL